MNSAETELWADCLTVGELIVVLDTYPRTARVCCVDSEYGDTPVELEYIKFDAGTGRVTL